MPFKLYDRVFIKKNGIIGQIIDIAKTLNGSKYIVESDIPGNRPDADYPSKWPLYDCQSHEIEKYAVRGLRTQESSKFNIFFSLIQEKAKKENAIFFADAGDGNDFETSDMEGENMMGWLIPVGRAKEFELLWMDSAVDDTWSEFYGWAIWARVDGAITIHFEV